MMNKIWSDGAWEDYLYWQSHSIKNLKKINKLLKEIERHPYEGTGHPEPLKHKKQGYWSRHVTEYDRLVYRVKNGSLEIAQCRAHYDD